MLGGGESPFRDDDGSADPRTAAALAAFGAGLGSEHAALTALASSRLLVPVVAVVAATEARNETEGPGRAQDDPGTGTARAGRGEHGSEMSLPTVVGRDGRPAIPVFTCLDALARWDERARPVPAQAGLVWRAAVDGSCAVVVDIAGPVPLAVEGARLAALAAGQAVPPVYEDGDVRAEVEAAIAAEPMITGFSLAPSQQVDLAVRLRLAAANRVGGDWRPVVNRAAQGIAGRLAVRLRRGVEFSVTRDAVGS